MRPDVPIDHRRLALRVLNVRDQNKARVDDSFLILVSLVEDPDQDPRLRPFAMDQLDGEINDVTRGGRFVSLLEACLADKAPAIRRRAAQRIANLPQEAGDNEQLTAWTTRLLNVARQRLLVEPDREVYHDLVAKHEAPPPSSAASRTW